MKIIIAALILTPTLVFSQDTTELDPIVEAPAIVEEAPAEAPVVTTEEESVVPDEMRVKEPMATFGVRGVAPDAVSKAKVEGDDETEFKLRESHWVGTFGFETTKFEVPFAYTGETISFKEENRELWGARLGFGREFYLGAGFLFGARLDGYFMGTLFENAKTADPDFPGTDVSNEKDSGHMYGGDAVAHLGWMFDFNTKNPILGEMTYMAMELFVEAGLGKGKSYQRKEYTFDASKVDYYDFKMEDDFTTQSVSAGLNFISRTTGAFLTLKATQMNIDVDKRTIRQKSISNGAQGTSTSIPSVKSTVDNPDIDPVTIFALSGGVKF